MSKKLLEKVKTKIKVFTSKKQNKDELVTSENEILEQTVSLESLEEECELVNPIVTTTTIVPDIWYTSRWLDNQKSDQTDIYDSYNLSKMPECPLDFLDQHWYDNPDDAWDHVEEVGQELFNMSPKYLEIWKDWARYHELEVDDEYNYVWFREFYHYQHPLNKLNINMKFY